MKVELLTTNQAFDDLHALAQGARKRPIKADRQILLNLLIDHSRMLAALRGKGVVVIEPKPHRERVKLEE
jgi:hypothetical protein